ncbi:hypothetical protein PHLCEN_2v3720 [Hermanssonia centrifuga]|uniref:JmjC domain-containing protein n=1 Tax=Hermanssonia centrifuga TaxID=98765 RepID=A0A2R6QEC4_9APHY|nr:hypothetical protein PHLCEN_2v3720 [Hermanssonia centrifuga]
MSLSYTEFFECYMKTNRPVIIGADLVSSWPAFVLWTTIREKNTCLPGKEINWDYLADRYGHHEVTVADCATSDSFGNLECTSSPFIDIVNKWKCGEGRSLYVKDWHLALTETSEAIEGSKKSQAFYITPDLFRDDWMNSYYTAHTADDFRFVYVGAAGTFTPLHRDVYCSYSWSTNVCGRKRWWLFPPEQTPYLFLKGRNVSVHDVRDVDLTRFPEYAKTTPIVVDQEEGETIFVENLTACISINHNWCNSVNLPSLYLSMCDKVVEVEEALEDVREMLITSQDNKEEETEWKREFVKIVQDVVKQDAGWK